MKRFPLVVAATLVLSLAACGDDGGGGGDEEAFCDALEALSDQVADGDLGDDDGLEDVTDTVNDLVESAADGEQLDAVRAVGGDVQDAQPEDADEVADTIQGELGDFAEDCDIDEDEFALLPTTTAPETTTSTEDTSTTEATTETTDDGGGDGGGDEPLVNAREPVPGDIAAEFAGLAQSCFDGDMVACDDLFRQTPVGSVDEAYGASCGGRLEEPQPAQCSTIVSAPLAVPSDVADQATAAACEAGDMVACDDLFNEAAEGSIDRAYGALCGGRVPNTTAFCVDIFGEVAFV